MLFSDGLNCGSLKSAMKTDEACLNIQSDSNLSLRIFGQSKECEGCPLFKLTSILPKQNASLIVSAKYPTILEVHADQKILCNSTFTFKEHGGYYWNISKNCSEIFEKYEADVTYLPILEAIIIFFCFFTLWYVTKSLYKRSNPTTSWADLFRFRHISRGADCTTALLDSQPSTNRPRRFRSIDTFRGISVVLMIFVNYGGGHYWFFEHSIWNGLTIADLVFPMFLWIMGFCLFVSLRARLSRETNKIKIFKHIVKRSLILIIMGIMLNSIKANNLNELRFPGVLQRIGITFFIVGAFELSISNFSDKTKYIIDFITSIVICLVHMIITFGLPVPDCPMGYLGPGGLHKNSSFALCTGGSAGYIDRLVFSNHIYKHSSFHQMYKTIQRFDPEGLLSTLSSLITVHLGFGNAYYLFKELDASTRILHWMILGLCQMLLGGFLCLFSINDGMIPINKNLWSLSFVFVTSGISIYIFSFLHYITDIKKKWFGRPFYYVGMNALFVYIGHMLTSNMFPFSWPPVYGSHREILFMNLTVHFLCQNLDSTPSIILDTINFANDMDNVSIRSLPILYQKFELSMNPVFELINKYLLLKDITYCAIIFETKKVVQEFMNYLIAENISKKFFITSGLYKSTINDLKKVRPYPEEFIVVADSNYVQDFYQMLIDNNYLIFPHQWLFFITDLTIKSMIFKSVNTIQFKYNHETASNIFDLQILSMLDILSNILSITNISTSTNLCQISSNINKNHKEAIFEKLIKAIYKSDYLRICNDNTICLKINAVFNNTISIYESNDMIVFNRNINRIKWVMRIGTTYALPWSYTEIDPETGTTHWTGYCIEFIKKLSDELNFDYEILVPINGTFGKKLPNGDWDGAIGDLLRGDIDMIATALIMTSQREKVLDYILPYFEETGISIIIRKQYEYTSLFKFIMVFKIETWLASITGIIITSVLLWLTEKYSPLSHPHKKLSLTSSFWFCLTSLTPLGGSDIPKSYSGRILVATYWLFVALLLATFTANLASFLTSERLRFPIKNIEQLASQSRVKYTVVKDSIAHKFFINMKNAEDSLHKMWKELVLNASSDDTIYQIWQYPFKEMYSEMLIAINDTIPVDSLQQGIEKVNNNYDSDFALIHDSSELEYELYKNCNLTEIGTPFAIKPYALAVAQGSINYDKISEKIVELQDKTQFFAELKKKYWNISLRSECLDKSSEEGIKLRNIGGVFIGAAIGFLIGVLFLSSELIHWIFISKKDNNIRLPHISIISESDLSLQKSISNDIDVFPYVD